MIEWDNTESSTPQNVPGKLLLFYRIQGHDEVWALVHCCGYETYREGMFESSGIISRHELCFQPSSAHRSVPTLERITIDWGSQIYHYDNYKHLRDAFIDPDQDLQNARMKTNHCSFSILNHRVLQWTMKISFHPMRICFVYRQKWNPQETISHPTSSNATKITFP